MKKFCKYCGKALYNGESCDCERAVAEAGSAAPIPPAVSATPAMPPKKKNFCGKCGRAIVDGMPCGCTTGAPVPPPISPKKFCGKCGRALMPGEMCSCSASRDIPGPIPGDVYGGATVKTTMRPKEPISPEEEYAKREGERFFEKAGDLD